MKTTSRGVVVGVVTMAAAWILGTTCVLRAQTESVPTQEPEPQPIAPEAVPRYCTFYLLSAPGGRFPSAPYPSDPYGGVLPIYALDASRHIYLIADTLDESTVVREAVKERVAKLEEIIQQTALSTAAKSMMEFHSLDSGGGQAACGYSSEDL